MTFHQPMISLILDDFFPRYLKVIQRPEYYSEISEIVSSKDYYKVKFGNPQTIIVLDTTFAYSSKILTEKIVYDFKTKSRIEIEKFKQSKKQIRVTSTNTTY